jgi:hypothetical protein
MVRRWRLIGHFLFLYYPAVSGGIRMKAQAFRQRSSASASCGLHQVNTMCRQPPGRDLRFRVDVKTPHVLMGSFTMTDHASLDDVVAAVCHGARARAAARDHRTATKSCES